MSSQPVENASEFYRRAGLKNHTVLRAGGNALFTRFAQEAERNPTFAYKLRQLDAAMTEMHGKVDSRDASRFYERVQDLTNDGENQIQRGHHPAAVLDAMLTRWQAKRPAQFLGKYGHVLRSTGNAPDWYDAQQNREPQPTRAAQSSHQPQPTRQSPQSRAPTGGFEQRDEDWFESKPAEGIGDESEQQTRYQDESREPPTSKAKYTLVHEEHAGVLPGHVRLTIPPVKKGLIDRVWLEVINRPEVINEDGISNVPIFKTTVVPLAVIRGGKKPTSLGHIAMYNPVPGESIGMSVRHAFTLPGRAFAIKEIHPDRVVISAMNRDQPQELIIPRHPTELTRVTIGSHPDDFVSLQTPHGAKTTRASASDADVDFEPEIIEDDDTSETARATRRFDKLRTAVSERSSKILNAVKSVHFGREKPPAIPEEPKTHYLFEHSEHEYVAPTHISLSISHPDGKHFSGKIWLTNHQEENASVSPGSSKTPLVKLVRGKKVEIDTDPRGFEPRKDMHVGLSQGHLFSVGTNFFQVTKVNGKQVILSGVDGPVAGKHFTFNINKNTRLTIGSHASDSLSLRTPATA